MVMSDEFNWDEDVQVTSINTKEGVVCLSNGVRLSHKLWYETFVNFWDRRIVGKAIIPIFYEYLFARGGSNQYLQLVKGKEHEGYLLGQLGKPMMDAKKAIAVGAILALTMGIVIAIVILKNQGLIPSF